MVGISLCLHFPMTFQNLPKIKLKTNIIFLLPRNLEINISLKCSDSGLEIN